MSKVLRKFIFIFTACISVQVNCGLWSDLVPYRYLSPLHTLPFLDGFYVGIFLEMEIEIIKSLVVKHLQFYIPYKVPGVGIVKPYTWNSTPGSI